MRPGPPPWLVLPHPPQPATLAVAEPRAFVAASPPRLGKRVPPREVGGRWTAPGYLRPGPGSWPAPGRRARFGAFTGPPRWDGCFPVCAPGFDPYARAACAGVARASLALAGCTSRGQPAPARRSGAVRVRGRRQRRQRGEGSAPGSLSICSHLRRVLSWGRPLPPAVPRPQVSGLSAAGRQAWCSQWAGAVTVTAWNGIKSARSQGVSPNPTIATANPTGHCLPASQEEADRGQCGP